MRAKPYCVATALFFCWVLAAWSTGPVIAQGARVRLAPETLTLAPGDTGTVEVRVEDVIQLAGAEVHLTFDSTLLEVVDADAETEGIQIVHGGFLSPDFVVQNIADPSAGTIDYAIVCMPLDKAVSGNGVLARITFRALADGETLVDVSSAILGNVQNQSIPLETASSIVVISRPGPSLQVWGMIGLAAVAVASGLVAVVWRAIKAR